MLVMILLGTSQCGLPYCCRITESVKMGWMLASWFGPSFFIAAAVLMVVLVWVTSLLVHYCGAVMMSVHYCCEDEWFTEDVRLQSFAAVLGIGRAVWKGLSARIRVNEGLLK